MPVKLSPREAYRLWAPGWQADPSAIVALESRHLSPWLPDLNQRVVLDVSCGAGRWLAYAQARGATVFGLDLCHEMLIEARKLSCLAGRLAQADALLLPLADRSADVAICALSLAHMPPLESAIYELARVVRSGGTLLVSDFHPAATARGWKRTFRSGGVSYEIETETYSVERLLESAERSGLRFEELIEPGFGEPEREFFERAGKPELFEQVRGVPAVLVARWTRP